MLLTTPLSFFGGKGGVGKTTLAAATALAHAHAGRRTLLVSTDPAHNLGHLWNTSLGDDPTEVAPGLEIIEINPERTTEAHLKAIGATMTTMMPEHLRGEVAKHLNLARHSPGTHEAALLERIAQLTESALPAYDHVIFDTAPSGHTARLMALPELMSAWTEGLLQRRAQSEKFSSLVRGLSATGRDAAVSKADPIERRNQQIRAILYQRQERFSQLRNLLQDPQRCSFAIVLSPERLPVLETVEFYSQLQQQHIAVAGLIVNRRSPANAGEFLRARRAIEDQALAELAAALPAVPVTEIELRPGEVGTAAALADIARSLSSE